MKIAHISDSHFSERLRLDITREVHAAAVDIAAREEADLWLHTGDVYDAASSPLARQAAADFFEAAAGIAPVVIVKGNHDARHDLAILGRIKSRYPIHVLEAPAIAEPHCLDIIDCELSAETAIIALPWVDRHAIASQLDEEVRSIGELTLRANRLFGHLFDAARWQAERLAGEGIVPIFAAHLMVMDSEIADGQTLFGTGLEVSADDVASVGAAYHALGHVHRAQSWHDGRVAYAGSPTALNYGEPERKSFNLVELGDDGAFASLSRMELPAPRLVRFEVDATDPEMPLDAATILRDMPPSEGARAIMRCRIKIEAERLAGLDIKSIRQAMINRGAREAKIDPVIVHTARERVAGFAGLTSTWSKVDAWLDATESGADRDDLESMLASIEKEVRDAAA